MAEHKKTDSSLIAALALADQCDVIAAELDEAMPAIAAKITQAARAIRGLHNALHSISVECMHTLTMRVTEQMHADGYEAREPGKYCMTCGIRIHEPERKRVITNNISSAT